MRRRNNRRTKKNFKPVIIVIAVIVILAIIFAITKIIIENNTMPEIALKGDEKIELNIGEEYNEEGAEATYKGNKIEYETIGKVNKDIPGEYKIEYKASIKNKEVQKERIVKVIDNVAPIIVLKGESKISVNKENEYEESGYTASDNVDGDITNKVEIATNLNINKAGSYEIKYSVLDSSGNKAEAIRTVEVVEKKYSKEKLKNGLPVLMYHFFYDKNDGKTPTSKLDNNYMEISDFENQIKYLSENNFYFPTWEEVENYIDGKINLPDKSVVITIDDGDESFFTYALPIIEKYDVKATEFIITSWYGWLCDKYPSKNMYYESHSDKMHEGASNGKSVMLSWSYDKILEDVKNSSDILKGATIFCYPFGQYNDLDKKVLKDAGYKLAFTTKYGRVYKGSDKYALSRIRTTRNMSLSEFKSMVN